MSEMRTKIMRDASYLLPPPGGEVVRYLLDSYAALLARHNALVEAVKAEIAARNDYHFWRCIEAISGIEMQEKYETLETARAEVNRLINMSHKELKF